LLKGGGGGSLPLVVRRKEEKNYWHPCQQFFSVTTASVPYRPKSATMKNNIPTQNLTVLIPPLPCPLLTKNKTVTPKLRSEHFIGSPLFFSLVPFRYRFTPRTSEKQKQRLENRRWLFTPQPIHKKQSCYRLAPETNICLFPQ